MSYGKLEQYNWYILYIVCNYEVKVTGSGLLLILSILALKER